MIVNNYASSRIIIGKLAKRYCIVIIIRLLYIKPHSCLAYSQTKMRFIILRIIFAHVNYKFAKIIVYIPVYNSTIKVGKNYVSCDQIMCMTI